MLRRVQRAADQHDIGRGIGAKVERQGIPLVAVYGGIGWNAGRRGQEFVVMVSLDFTPEPLIVGDDKAEVTNLRVVDVRPVDFVENSMADRDPDSGRTHSRAHAVFITTGPGGGNSRLPRRIH